MYVVEKLELKLKPIDVIVKNIHDKFLTTVIHQISYTRLHKNHRRTCVSEIGSQTESMRSESFFHFQSYRFVFPLCTLLFLLFFFLLVFRLPFTELDTCRLDSNYIQISKSQYCIIIIINNNKIEKLRQNKKIEKTYRFSVISICSK